MPTAVKQFNPPPGWPTPAPGWTPPADWQPDPCWPPAPPHWNFWVVVETAPTPLSRGQRMRLTVARMAVVAVAIIVVGSSATQGWVGLLLGAGIMAMLAGITAALRGRLPSAWLINRAVGVIVAGIGLALFMLGVVFSAGSATPISATAPSSPTTTPTVNSARKATPTARPKSSPTPKPKQSSRPEPSPTTAPVRSRPAPPPAAADTALAAVALLTAKGRAPMTGYGRSEYGQAWADVDGNGCDTRDDILRRDLDPVTVEAGTNGCLVLAGVLHDPYTDATIDFTRGVATSAQVQIDHVVALGDSWQKGAQHWSAAKREDFANDPLNLLAVDGPANDWKGDGDTATWLPPNKADRCSYVSRQVAVKRAYALWVTVAERDAMERVLRTCPNQALPTEQSSTHRVAATARVTSAPVPTATSTPTPRATTNPPPGTGSTKLDPRFLTCADANADGYGPYRQGTDPEYYWYRDADHDGIDCER